jgi:hypothetical protein
MEAGMARGGGRNPTKEEFWRRMIRGQARSGLSIRAWCRERHLQEHAFYWWRARLARTGRRSRTRSQKAMLVPIQVSAPVVIDAENPIEIVLPNDRRIRVRGRVDRQALTDVLAALAQSTSSLGPQEAPSC